MPRMKQSGLELTRFGGHPTKGDNVARSVHVEAKEAAIHAGV